MLLAFALGLIANPWFERNIRSHLPGFAASAGATADEVAASRVALATLQGRVSVLETRPAAPQVSATSPALPANVTERLARAEARLDGLERVDPATTARLDKVASELAALTGRVEAGSSATQATLASATASAEQAQRLLVLLSVRRAIESGSRLGALDPVLRRQFALDYPQPVEAVAALGGAPMTLAALRAAFDRVRPELAAPATGADRSWWGSLSDSLASVVQIRRTADPVNGTDSVSRVARAAVALRAGDIVTASEQVGALPPPQRARAAAWLAAAMRYTNGQRGLATLENAALTEPSAPSMPTLVGSAVAPAPGMASVR